ncbi:MAG: FAD-binding protein, partial [Nitrospirae bacterium]
LQAAVGEGDDPARHFADALAGGHGENDRRLLRALVEAAPEAAQWLARLGVRWDREADGRPRLRSGGGTSRPRLLACADYTGLEIMRVLAAELEAAGVGRLDYHPAVELLTAGGRVTGALLLELRTGRIRTVSARAVVLATGGAGRLHLGGAPTSNHYGATGDGLVLAYRAGCRLVHPESYQYHPTGVAHPHALAGALITEGVRAAGATLRNREGDRFVDEMLPRDVVAAAIWAEAAAGRAVPLPEGGSAVWLDCRGVEGLAERFPSVVQKLARAGVALASEPVLVAPTLHFQNGGVRVDPDGATDLPGLFACGEVAGGAHGTNRLMGNALLEVVALGRRAGAAAARAAKTAPPGPPALDHLAAWPGTGPPAPVLLPDPL